MNEKNLTKKQLELLQERNEQISYWVTRLGNHDGAKGIIKELQSAPLTSSKTKLSKQGKNDIHLKWLSDNEVKTSRPAEIKTSGGRIGSILRGRPEALVIYSLDVCNKSTGYVRRETPQILLTYGEFIVLLMNSHAIKGINRNGQFEEHGVQASSLPLFLRLLEIAEAHPERVYNPEVRYSLRDLTDISGVTDRPYKLIRRC